MGKAEICNINCAPVPAWWEAFHRDLGCYGCKFADLRLLGKGPCCNRPGAYEHKDGKCLDRED